METDLEIGAVVKLKSSGPNMVIASEHPIEAGWVTCQWFDDKNELREKAFPEWALENVARARRWRLNVIDT
jgi:uncharacterized protein YodC (DUF2158 family)